MKVRKFIQIVEVGKWVGWDWRDSKWVAETTYKDADTVNIYREEAKKEDVSFWRGTYTSPRLGEFCITYQFIEESEG